MNEMPQLDVNALMQVIQTQSQQIAQLQYDVAVARAVIESYQQMEQALAQEEIQKESE